MASDFDFHTGDLKNTPHKKKNKNKTPGKVSKKPSRPKLEARVEELEKQVKLLHELVNSIYNHNVR